MFSTVCAEWHRQRSWFSPAFSMAHLITLVPAMVEEYLVFRETLTKYAVSGEMCKVDNETTKLAIDVIGCSVANLPLNSQTQDCPVLDEFLAGISWTMQVTDSIWNQIVGPIIRDRHLKKLDKLLGDMIKGSFKNKKGDSVDKSIMDLALKGYLKVNGRSGVSKGARMDLDEKFMRLALDNAKIFFLAGHDTTAGMMSYMFYYLSITPSVLARVREEHNNVLGSTLSSTLTNIREKPQLLNALPLTQAVIKEVLRLHHIGPAYLTAASQNETLTHNGHSYSMSKHMILILSIAYQRSSRFFTNPHVFDPDRFLDTETNVSVAWQPFYRGKRDCIGQQIALLEGRTLAVLTVRWFDFRDEFGEAPESLREWGGNAYQVAKMTASPKGAMLMRVKLSEG